MNRCVLNLGASRLPLPNFLIDIIMKMTNEIYPDMRPGANRFNTRYNGDVLLARITKMFIEKGVINPVYGFSLRAYCAFFDPLDVKDEHKDLFKIVLRDIFKVVPTDAINKLPNHHPTKKQFLERCDDFYDYIMYIAMNSN